MKSLNDLPFTDLCRYLDLCFYSGDHDMAVKILAELRTRVSESQYSENS